MVRHQGGLSVGWLLIRVVFHQGSLRVICHQGGLSSGGLSSGRSYHEGGCSLGWSLIWWSVIRVVSHPVVCHQGGLSRVVAH